MHDAVLVYVAKVVSDFDLKGDVLDLGGRDVNGTPRHLFPYASSYTVVDAAEDDTVDIVADAAELNLAERFDTVVSTELLEHTPKGKEIVATAYRHLKDGGVFVATMAGPGRNPHGMSGATSPAPDEWYENVTPEMLDGWLAAAGFSVWQVDQLGNDVRCWARR